MKEKNNTHRVVTFLSREQLDFLDKMEKDMLFTSGKYISRSQIIQDLAELLSRTGLDASGIKSNEELQNKIFEAIVKMKAEQSG